MAWSTAQMCDIACASDLLARTQALREDEARRDLVSTEEAFQRLRRGWEENRRTPRHNIIRLLGLDRSEIGFYSPFLHDLLDPFGSHGQGDLFLRAFLALISGSSWRYRWPTEKPPSLAGWKVISENSKIDLQIKNRSEQVIIFIENKVDAGFQDRQLIRYKRRLEEHRFEFAHRLLVLLSRRNMVVPPDVGHPDVHLTYGDHLAPWVQTIIDKIEPGKLRGNLEQYHELISEL